MRLIIMLCVLMSASDASSEESKWTAMNGEKILTVLTGNTVKYGETWQDFHASGRTLYNAGHDSWGYWAVRGEQYCSLWPPQDLWACYDMQIRGNTLRFWGRKGDITEGVLSD